MDRIPGGPFYFAVAWGLRPVTRAWFGLKVVGRENLAGLPPRGRGVITVSNHVAGLDSVMVAGQLLPRRCAFTAQPQNFQLPVAGRLVAALGCLATPRRGDEGDAARFLAEVGDRLSRGWAVHYFPEGHLVPYCRQVREFRPGAFNAAVRFQAPVLPLRFTWEEPGPIRRLLRRRPRAVLHILPPQHPAGEGRADALELMERTRRLLVEAA
ncbi:MAG: 1-acyl-sn-glycerol-3-phosphate acyltransferase [Promicromonosporaceae bacterium]|nr:1-acyl-sn-glycerol-3-phosphate acyltransferase [Promicromonosporaceae bacterium]